MSLLNEAALLNFTSSLISACRDNYVKSLVFVYLLKDDRRLHCDGKSFEPSRGAVGHAHTSGLAYLMQDPQNVRP